MNLINVKLKTLIVCLVLSFVSLSASAKDVFYVKSGGTGDGSSWSKAMGNIQQAVDSAATMGADVWVAKGVYYSDSSAVVYLKPGVSLYGGFAGTELSLLVRDTAANPTVLDGNDSIQVICQQQNFDDSLSVVVDGFTIQNGMAENGGGAYLRKNATLDNCIIKGCQAVDKGIAVYSNGGNILRSLICENGDMSSSEVNKNATLYFIGGKIDSCIVKNNEAYGIGVLRTESTIIKNSLFEGNKSYNNRLFDCNKSTIMSDCRIINHVTDNGNTQFFFWSSSKVERCVFDGNENGESILYLNGGAEISNSRITNCTSRSANIVYMNGSSKMKNCTIVDNVSKSVTVTTYSAIEILNSIIVGNTRTSSTEVVTRNYEGKIIYSMIEGGTYGEGNMAGNKMFAAFNDPENGDYSLSESSFCINAGKDVDDSIDALGNPRKQGGAVDLGAIESSSTNKPTSSIYGDVIYVKKGSTGTGMSWDDALGEIDDAVIVASTLRRNSQIWVSAGVYYGDTTRKSAVILFPGVSLYGGFAGNEISLTQRDVEKNLTSIDGKKVRRCLFQDYDFADSLTVNIDGFTLINGYSGFWDEGGGCAYIKKNVTLTNCIIKNTYGSFNDGFRAFGSVLRKCKFIDNYQNHLNIQNGVVDSCIFTAPNSNDNCKVSLSNSTLTNCSIYQNPCSYGALYASNNSYVSNCKVYNNVTIWDPLININNSTLENCLIYDNSATRGQTIIYGRNNAIMTNCTVVNNTTEVANIVTGSTDASSNFTIANSIIYNNKMTKEFKTQVDTLVNFNIKHSASEESLAGDNNIKLSFTNNGSDSTQNYVCFINAVGGDYRLHSTSSCIDKGVDSVMSAKVDLNGNARIYGKAIDLGAIEYNGETVDMIDYHQVVCNNQNSLEATFDSTISKIDWIITNAGKVSGYKSKLGSGSTIPSMTLYTSKNDIDTLTIKVTPYDKDSVAGVPFNYYYIVYPDMSEIKMTFVEPNKNYVEKTGGLDMAIQWRQPSISAAIDHYELYLWKASQNMPTNPVTSLVNGRYRHFYNLDNHTTYLYMVKAITMCDTISSEIDTFVINKPENLQINGSAVCELGTKLNDTTFTTRFINGFELKDSITYSITGKDSADFSISLSKNWNDLNGGYFDVYYYPTDANKPLSTATLTFTSGNHTATLDLNGILANYHVFDAVVENEVYKAGDTITIKGYVSDAYGNPLEDKLLKVYLIKNDLEIKSFDAVSNVNGEVVVKYVSYPYETGVYSVGVCLKGESSKAILDEFDIPGISCNIDVNKWRVQRGDTLNGTLTVTNRSNVVAKSVKVKTLTLANGCKVVFDSIDVLNGLESKKINYYVVGQSVTEGNDYLTSSFRVETSDGLTSNFSTNFYCETPYGQIKVLPANIKEYVSKQNPKNIELLLINEGQGESGKVTLSLPKFDGITMPAGSEIDNIKSGDTVKATLKLAYYDGAPLNTSIDGTIAVNCENGKATSIDFTMEYTSSSIGNVVVDVVDEYYYNSTSKKHLEGATVEIKNAFNSQIIASATTDSTGKVRFDSIPEGDYLLSIKAEKHSDYKETITVQAEQTLNKFAFVSYEAITYTWNVERVEIEDKYEMTLETEFETNVPAPVVTLEIPNGIPSMESFSPGDKNLVYMVITNHGLIAAKNVKLTMPDITGFEFSVETDHIDSLPASYSVVMPLVVSRTSEYIGEYMGGGSNIHHGGSSSFESDKCNPIIYRWEYICGVPVHKESYYSLWVCKNIDFDIDINGPDRFGIRRSSVTHGNCKIDTCEVKSKISWQCIADLITPFCEFNKITKSIMTGVNHLRSGHNMGSGVVKYANSAKRDKERSRVEYNLLTGVIGLYVNFPFSCFDDLCKQFACINFGENAEDCGEYLYYAQQAFDNNSKLRSAYVKNVSFYDVASPNLLAKHDFLEYAMFAAHGTRYFSECLGLPNEMLQTSGVKTYLDYTVESISTLEKIDVDGVKNLPVSNLSLTEMLEITDRWNRSIDAWSEGVTSSNDKYTNIANKKVYDECVAGFDNFINYVIFRNFDNVDEMFGFISDNIEEKSRNSVCASVKLQISQTMSMTREAFDGTLIVNNGQESLDMDSFKVVIDIRDENGESANDLFQINTHSLIGISSVDGTESIASGDEATAVFRFIPERGAAPKTPVNYSFGGKIIYVQNGDTITIDLNPVTLTVYPSPNLQIDYFMQRNILGDDALTHDRVEPTVPAALGVIINNQGYGVAKNVKLESAQPTIVDNEKGLLIDFDIIGSSLNGKDCNLGSQNIDFGNIDAQSSKTGLWWLTSSLLGHFTKYEANVVHANSYGNAELSLVNGVAIHELIKTVDAYGDKEDGVADFLVNDDSDFNDTPDAIYYSNGGKDTVTVAKSAKLNNASLTLSDTIVSLSVTPSDSGWTYVQLDDPGNNNYVIEKVVRVKDNVELPLSNVWTTFVTLPDGEEPIYENRLHFLDYMSTLGESDYNIYYSIKKNILNVSEISGVPENEKTVTAPVDSVVVKFNRAIQKQSFDYNDIEFYCQAGDDLSDSTITIKQIDELTYVVNISSKTKTSGFYKIEVNVNNIYDKNGYSGEFGKSAAWTQFIEEPEDDFTPVVDVEDDRVIVYSKQNHIYVEASKPGSVDIYDIVSRLVVKDAKYGEGVSCVATLPCGVYIVNGYKLIVK